MHYLQKRKDKGPRDLQAAFMGFCVIGFVLCCVLFILDPAMEAERKASEAAYARATARVEPIYQRSQWKDAKSVQEAPRSAVKTVQEPAMNRRLSIRQLYDIGVQNSSRLIELLDNDVFETRLGSSGFRCPADKSDLVDSPSIVNSNALKAFRDNTEVSFIFYQHLRKAGGTGFCDLANSNLPKKTVPGYYCMPDNRGSLATNPWNNMNYTLDRVREKKFRIIANEWDTFRSAFVDYPNVVLATTIRHPIDRWYSQYRFEHLEHRDGSKADAPRQPFLQWYKGCVGWTMGRNYYVKTFLGEADAVVDDMKRGDFYWTYHKFNKREKSREQRGLPAVSWEEFELAVRHLRQFHILLVMEWLGSSGPMVERLLGWRVPPKQVLPHEVQAVRADKRSKASRDVVPAPDYAWLLRQNVFDLLFFEIAKRVYLERERMC